MRKCTHNAKLPSKTPQLFKAKCLKKFTPNYSKHVKLNALMRKIDTDKVGEPAFRMVLTAVGSYAVTLQDGTCSYWMSKRLVSSLISQYVKDLLPRF